MMGIVNWFDEKKGYGFIKVEGLEHDVFVHYSEIKTDEFKSLKENDVVTFDYDNEKKRALNVRVQMNEENV